MNFYQFLSILGVPSIISIVLYFHRKDKSISLGVQALLRAQMINDYNKWTEKGYAPLYAKENFENCYKQYHELGANGFMDKLRDEFLGLPITK